MPQPKGNYALRFKHGQIGPLVGRQPLFKAWTNRTSGGPAASLSSMHKQHGWVRVGRQLGKRQSSHLGPFSHQSHLSTVMAPPGEKDLPFWRTAWFNEALPWKSCDFTTLTVAQIVEAAPWAKVSSRPLVPLPRLTWRLGICLRCPQVGFGPRRSPRTKAIRQD